MAKKAVKLKPNQTSLTNVCYPELFILVNIHHNICNYRWDTLDHTRSGAWHKLNPKESQRSLRKKGWKCVPTKMTLEFKNLIMDPKPLT